MKSVVKLTFIAGMAILLSAGVAFGTIPIVWNG